jgi:hypothetical protein
MLMAMYSTLAEKQLGQDRSVQTSAFITFPMDKEEPNPTVPLLFTGPGPDATTVLNIM